MAADDQLTRRIVQGRIRSLPDPDPDGLGDLVADFTGLWPIGVGSRPRRRH
jgi:hypothetical protein